jgi:predicted nucleic acid-binding protein
MSNYILLDTNIIIYALEEKEAVLNFLNDKIIAVSFCTEIELLGWKNITATDKNEIDLFLSKSIILEYDLSLKRRTIHLKSTYRLKLADAFIAATALEFDIPLVSADKVFEKVKELNFIKLIPKK